MITLKKLIYSAALVAVASAIAVASVTPPLDNKGNSLFTLDFVGAKACAITPSTGTNAVECMTGRGVVFGVVISSVTNLATNFLVLRDSNTANTSSSSFTFVGAQPNGPAQILVGNTVMQTFPRPIQFTNGLSANMTTAPGQGEMWTILYRPLTATE